MFSRKNLRPARKKIKLEDGLWLKCESCGEILYRKELDQSYWICPKCNFHFRIDHQTYIKLLLDDGKLDEIDRNLVPTDPLGFPKYKEKYKTSVKKTNIKEGIISGRAKIADIPVIYAATDFGFMGGSMGSVVGEKVARAARLALKEKIPFVMLTASGGGARMQEGILSLMQMVKTSAEVALLKQAGIPYINILTHPTMAGVMASFASLGDVIIAEPGALLGFTGPRVIEQTIGEKLPPGFQRSEFLLDHGFVDIVCTRRELRDNLVRVLDVLVNHVKNQ
ncbi:acetyl-CoA carboxylase carboxyltransferase subunit beta [candidate division WOR-3 bacterium]|nr:acetyl-CoA carboxylase carboxyltransferase subunit beta [candidate division WOR-3 bacterium]